LPCRPRRGHTPSSGPVRKAIKKATGDVLIVGHVPFLDKLAGQLLTGKKSSRPITFQCA